MEDRISVRLTGPAKVDGRWRKPGEDVPVTLETVRQLKDAGVIAAEDGVHATELVPGMPGFDEAVAAMAKVLADAAVSAAVEAATVELIAERDGAITQLIKAECELINGAARIAELEVQIANASPPSGGQSAGSAASSSDEPAAPEAAKPAKKSGAAKKD